MYAHGRGSGQITEILNALNEHDAFKKKQLSFGFNNAMSQFFCHCSGNDIPWGDDFVKECGKVVSEKLGNEITFEA